RRARRRTAAPTRPAPLSRSTVGSAAVTLPPPPPPPLSVPRPTRCALLWPAPRNTSRAKWLVSVKLKVPLAKPVVKRQFSAELHGAGTDHEEVWNCAPVATAPP